MGQRSAVHVDGDAIQVIEGALRCPMSSQPDQRRKLGADIRPTETSDVAQGFPEKAVVLAQGALSF